MESIVAGSIPSPAGIVAVAAILALTLVVVDHIRRNTEPRKIEGVYIAGLQNGELLKDARNRFIADAAGMMQEGLEKSSGGLFYVPSPTGERLMIPTKYLQELKNAPDAGVDFTASFVEMFAGDYTTIGVRWNLHPRVIKASLNAKLEIVMPEVDDEIHDAFHSAMPSCEDWTPVPVVETIRGLIARASSRMMGGKVLSRNDEWLQTSISFTTNAWLAAQKLKSYPAVVRPVAQWLVPEMAALRNNLAVAHKVIIPLVRSRMEAQSKELKPGEKPVDLLQMLMEGAEGDDKTPEFLAYTMLAVAFAAIHTSASVPVHVIYDLCAYPEYIEPLRQEAKAAFEKHGIWNKAALNELVMLDSFMKESQRFNPLVFMTFGRVIHKDLQLSDGLTIPAKTVIGIPSHAINQNPDFYPNPSEFQGYRFLDKGPSHKSESQRPPSTFVTTSPSSMSWGYGKHACSGRFFASYEIKIIVALYLLNYDFKFGDDRKTRPNNWPFELQNAPDPGVSVVFKRRN